MNSYLHHLNFENVQENHLLHARVFYGNACKICFKKVELDNRCRSCKTVPYCSEKHRKRDLPTHKKICYVLRKAEKEISYVDENCSPEDFSKYMEIFKEFIKKELGEDLTPFERDVMELQWVCNFCYSKENLMFECEKCEAVAYCSEDHKMKDFKRHTLNCMKLKMARIFDSLFYKEGIQLAKEWIKGNALLEVLNFPSDITKLCCRLQRQIGISDMDKCIQMAFLNSTFSAAASVLYGLSFFPFYFVPEKKMMRKCTGFCRPHFLESFKEKKLLIHVVDADFYEVTQFRPKSLVTLLEWMPSIHSVELHLFGLTRMDIFNKPNFDGVLKGISNLQYAPLQSKNIIDYKYEFEEFPKMNGLCNVTPIWHPSNNKFEVKPMKIPSVIVLFNYGCSDKINKFEDEASQKALFKYHLVPVVITSVNEKKLEDFVGNLRRIPDVVVITDVRKNPYAETRPYRTLKDGQMSTFNLNEFIAVLYREKTIAMPRWGYRTKHENPSGRKNSSKSSHKLR